VRDTNPDNVGMRFSTQQPEHMFKLSTVYRAGRLRVGGGVTWQSKIYRDFTLADSTPVRNQQGAYAVVDLMMGYAINDHLDMQANVGNIFDKKYYQAVSGSYTTSYDIYGEPRNFMLTIRGRF